MKSDIIIIGKGPAGISAALYMLRAGFKTMIIGKDGGSLERAEKIENYYGLVKPISGKELLDIGYNQAVDLGALFIDAEVTNMDYDGEFHVNIAKSDEKYDAEAVIIATGSARQKPQIEGINQLEGMGVSYCAVCDAFFYRGKSVGVIGSGEYALHEFTELNNIVGSVAVFTNGQKITAEFPENTKIYHEKINGIIGETSVSGILLSDGSEIALQGVFIALGSAGASELARKLGAEISNGKIKTDEKQNTNIPGLFAAGDCTGGILQVSVAVGEGAKAALSAIAYLRNKKKA